MKILSIIVPVYNEEKTIGVVLEKVIKSKTLHFSKEIIVIDDCSTDATPQILNSLEKTTKTDIMGQRDCKIIFTRNEKNIGKTATLKKAFAMSKGDIVIVQDADLEYDPSDYEKLLLPFVELGADVVYGSRFLGGEAKRILYFWHALGNGLLTLLSNMCSNLNLTDMETGYKVFKGDLIRNIAPTISSGRFGFEPEVTAKISKIPELNIYEVGIKYRGRTYKEGKKINWIDGVFAIIQIFRYNLFTK